MSRYIDADKLYKRMQDICTCYEEGVEVKEEALSMVYDFPTADVEEVKHGKWIITEYEYYDCSECGESYYNGCDSHAEAKRRLEINQDVYSYCPYCGAKMDREKEKWQNLK